MRHGESVDNVLYDSFTFWTKLIYKIANLQMNMVTSGRIGGDAPLTPKGIAFSEKVSQFRSFNPSSIDRKHHLT
jgi:hypothetical protein